MPWWSWIIIWGLLILALLGMLVWFGFTLFRKFLDVADALGQLAEKTELLDERIDELAPQLSEPAIFGDRDELAEVVELQSLERERRRQIRRDLLVKRGKLLVKADAQQFSHLTKRI
jgi:hypothetical protein